jgi:hypothetical protein
VVDSNLLGFKMLLFISCSNQPSKGIMKKTICFKTCVIALLLAFAATLLTPSSVCAQAYWLRYQMSASTAGGNPQEDAFLNFDSGPVQSASLATTNIIFSFPHTSTYASPSANFGLLQFTGGCAVNDNPSNGDGYSSHFGPGVGGGADVFFQDTLTVTSATLPAGTPVQIQVACVYYGSITPGATSGSDGDGTDSSASVGLTVRPNGPTATASGTVGAFNQTNTISVIANTTVGFNNFILVPTLSASGDASNGGDAASFSGSVSAGIASQTYVDVLTPGASYTSASGTVYPTLLSAPPTLSIQPAANGVTLFWPVSTTTYRLQQNADLTTANWVSNSIPINVANGTNQVTISPAVENMFFRLISP